MKTEMYGNKRIACVACKSELYHDIVIIGNQYPSAIYPSTNTDYSDLVKSSSLNVTQCKNSECNLVQLSHEYNLSEVFKYYPYVSGSTATMQSILKDLAKEAELKTELTSRDVVLDIGGNDGTLLNNLSQPVLKQVNIDAAYGIESVVKDDNYIRIQSQFSAKAYQELGLPSPKLIFSVAMFYHLDDPVQFCKQVNEIMSNETVWCLQMTYLGRMLEDNIYDNIVHEHVAYYSLGSLEYVLKLAGLKIFDAKIVESYGGSLRVYIIKSEVTADNYSMTKSLILLREHERKIGFNKFEKLLAFNQRIQILKKITKDWIEHLVEKNGPIMALGASTKGNMICQFLGLGREHISVVLDNNSKKIGSFLVGSGIPIVSEIDYFARVGEYIFLLPYYYKNFFRTMLSKHLLNEQKRYLMIPLPSPHMLSLI